MDFDLTNEPTLVPQAEAASRASILPAGRHARFEEFGGIAAFPAVQPAPHVTASVLRADTSMIRSV